MALDNKKTIAKIAVIIEEIVALPTVGNESRAAYLLGISQPSVNRLRRKQYDNLSDIPTFEAIARYRKQTLSEFFRDLEEDCDRPLSEEELARQAIANILRIKDKDKLIEINFNLANYLNFLIKMEDNQDNNQ